MNKIVFCDERSCIHNYKGTCTRIIIRLYWNGANNFWCEEREIREENHDA